MVVYVDPHGLLDKNGGLDRGVLGSSSDGKQSLVGKLKRFRV